MLKTKNNGEKEPKVEKLKNVNIVEKRSIFILVRYLRGYQYCSTKCASEARKGKKRNPFTEEHKKKISKNHHNVSGENNPNLKGGISSEKIKHKNKTWKQYQKWRKDVLERDNYTCKNCGSCEKLHAHHIIARKTLPKAEFIRANGVTLCEKCHRKTDSWGGGTDIIKYNRKGNLLQYILKVIPHSWQDYPTIGNYFYIKGGTIVIFCSDMKNNDYHQLIFAHEMFEVALVIKRKINIKEIDKFDINFEKEREKGLHGKDDEPGDNKSAPYHKEHVFATKLEKLLAKEMDVNWEDYSKTVSNL